MPVFLLAILRLSRVSWWYSWLPCEKLSRDAHADARRSRSSLGSRDTGPRVHTMLDVVLDGVVQPSLRACLPFWSRMDGESGIRSLDGCVEGREAGRGRFGRGEEIVLWRFGALGTPIGRRRARRGHHRRRGRAMRAGSRSRVSPLSRTSPSHRVQPCLPMSTKDPERSTLRPWRRRRSRSPRRVACSVGGDLRPYPPVRLLRKGERRGLSSLNLAWEGRCAGLGVSCAMAGASAARGDVNDAASGRPEEKVSPAIHNSG